MTPTNRGAIRLFRFAGIDVYLHWLWFPVALYIFRARSEPSTPFAWNVVEYLALFGIVLLHEFGHSLACRQVGGRANQIILWPLGGVAYVEPPQRPGATLWSIAAGPLVNVILAPIIFLAAQAMRPVPDAHRLLNVILYIDIGLLVFNLLPIYPLDGGQILRSLLWFPFGQAWSLIVATIVGFIGVIALVLLAIVFRSGWLGVISAFILLNCWGGLRSAIQLLRLKDAPRREGFACPLCHTAPPTGAFWVCGRCQNPFDMFEKQPVCPRCGASYAMTRCFDCGNGSPVEAWMPLGRLRASENMPPAPGETGISSQM